jgi:hypothetical protein
MYLDAHKNGDSKMKHVISFLVAIVSLAGPVSFSQDSKYFPVSMIELMANPEKLNGAVVSVRGFLQIQLGMRELTSASLYLHEEDAKYALDNEIGISLSEKMINNIEKIDQRYVSLTGKVKVTATASGWRLITITDIQSCTPLVNQGHLHK